MEELKPCPICGGTKLATSYSACINMDHEFMPDTVHMHVFDLYCKECGCRVQEGGDTYDEAKEAVVEKWNRRAERTCHVVPMDMAGNPPYRKGSWVLDALSDGCSECGFPFDTTNNGRPRYCPNCGAKVTG